MQMPVSLATPFPLAFAIATVLCVIALVCGVALDTPQATMIACGAILALGLPHGTLDLDLLKQTQPGVRRTVILLLYIGVAGAMAGIWLAGPIFALALFYTLAVIHFGEDWTGSGSTFLAQGIALALLTIPALTHPAELTDLFAALTSASSSTVFVDLLRLVAPVAAMLSVVGVGLLWTKGERTAAIGGGIALVGMTMLPPVTGFALFFCLFHSPRHLQAGLGTLASRSPERYGPTIVLLTLAAAAIAAMIYRLGVALPPSDRLMTASFITLSILTLPHMAVPIVLRALGQTKNAYADLSPLSQPLSARLAKPALVGC